MNSFKSTVHSIAVLFFLSFAFTANAQSLKETLSNSESPLVYLGIDFTNNRLLDVGNPNDIRDRLYNGINQLILAEPKKFDLKGAFNKTEVESDLDAVTENNGKININDIISTKQSDFERLKEADISAVVKALDIKKKEGVGVLFIFEAMRKLDKKGDAAIWVTFVDLKTKKVLMTERIVAKTSMSIGFRNYWASAIKNLIDTIDSSKYKEWKKKYAS